MSDLRQHAEKLIEKRIADMRRANALIDEANNGAAYQLGLVSLALMTRQFLRDCHDDLLAALRQSEARPLLRDPRTFKHRFEDEGIEIVAAIKRDYLPDMDSNDGGEMLSWILRFADRVFTSALEARQQPDGDWHRVYVELAAAVSRDPQKLSHKGLVALAQAHQQDSEDRDALEAHQQQIQQIVEEMRHWDSDPIRNWADRLSADLIVNRREEKEQKPR